jgi:hypothetical protein
MDIATPSRVTTRTWSQTGPVFYPRPFGRVTLSISSGSAVSNVTEFHGYTNFAVDVPAGTDGAKFEVLAAVSTPGNIGDMLQIDNGAGGAVTFGFTAGRLAVPLPAVFERIPAAMYVALRTVDAAGAPVNQADDRSLVVGLSG